MVIRRVNGTPPPTESQHDRERREARAELYKKHRYGGPIQGALALMLGDIASGTYDAHCAEWVNMLKIANLLDNRQ